MWSVSNSRSRGGRMIMMRDQWALILRFLCASSLSICPPETTCLSVHGATEDLTSNPNGCTALCFAGVFCVRCRFPLHLERRAFTLGGGNRRGQLNPVFV